MKMLKFIIGLISTVAFSLGWVFSILQWPGGSELSIWGFAGFAFIYLPMLAVDFFKSTIKRTKVERLKFLFGLVSGILAGLSIIFKLWHLQGADILLMVGSGLFIFGFLPLLFFTMFKKSVS
ncbi:MAG: hypothetical protein HC811_03065 [Flammeovirgaceae bacterium]|nr:hypothetical protein [Flammeovirgaceae bacterium]